MIPSFFWCWVPLGMNYLRGWKHLKIHTLANPHSVYHILCTLYGLQSTYEWYTILHSTLENLGSIIHCEVDHGVFIGCWSMLPSSSVPMPTNGSDLIMLIPIHVEDGLAATNSSLPNLFYGNGWFVSSTNPLKFLTLVLLHFTRAYTSHSLPFTENLHLPLTHIHNPHPFVIPYTSYPLHLPTLSLMSMIAILLPTTKLWLDHPLILLFAPVLIWCILRWSSVNSTPTLPMLIS